MGGWSVGNSKTKTIRRFFKDKKKSRSHIEIQSKSRIYLLLDIPERVKKEKFAETIHKLMLTKYFPKWKKGIKPQIQASVQSLS